MQSEKRLRGHTFYVDPDSGADSHDRRSVSSRWQWSRSHFVQTNNTAFPLSSSRRAARPGSGSGYVTPDQPNDRSQHRPPAPRSPARLLIVLQHRHRGRSGSGSGFKGDGRSRQLILPLKEGNKCQAALGIYMETILHDPGFVLPGNYNKQSLTQGGIHHQVSACFISTLSTIVEHQTLLLSDNCTENSPGYRFPLFCIAGSRFCCQHHSLSVPLLCRTGYFSWLINKEVDLFSEI